MDLVIGSITDYSFSHIKNWVNSLDRCGFTGVKALLCYNIKSDVVQELSQRGYTIFAFNRNEQTGDLTYESEFNIVRERFIHLWYFLNQIQNKSEYRYMVATDVKDVIFQKNPSEWLEQNLNDPFKINVASESIQYKNEWWGRNNLYQSFGPLLYATHEQNVIFNCGTLSGRFEYLLDLFLNIYLCSLSTAAVIPGGGGSDQAALNILIQTAAYRDITRTTPAIEPWAAQLGTTNDPTKVESYRAYLTPGSTATWKDNQICTSFGEPYYLVHQYDRVPEWKALIDEQYA